MMNNNFEAITFTTFGYKDFTENLLKSIVLNKTDLNLNVYALDKKSENYQTLEPNIVHFNYVLGEEKIELMKKYNEWYL